MQRRDGGRHFLKRHIFNAYLIDTVTVGFRRVLPQMPTTRYRLLDYHQLADSSFLALIFYASNENHSYA